MTASETVIRADIEPGAAAGLTMHCSQCVSARMQPELSLVRSPELTVMFLTTRRILTDTATFWSIAEKYFIIAVLDSSARF